MDFTLSTLVAMAWRTIKNPREGAEEVLALGIPKEALWTILVLVVVLSIMLAQVTSLILGLPGAAVGLPMSPAVTGGVQFVMLVVMVFAIHWVGRALGGRGSLEESILLVSWLQFIMVCLQVVQTLSLLVLPVVASLLGVVGLVLFLWLLTNFIAVLHGFKSLGQVFVMILVTAFAFAFVASILLTVIGVSMPMGTI